MLTEASAAVSLPYIDRENQKLYVWFLIVFPSILITLFFLTLNFNNKSLYSPADHAKEKPREISHASLSASELAHANPATDPYIRPPQSESLLSKSGIKFISYSPKNFIFLPQGYKDYDSYVKKTFHKGNDLTLEEHRLSQDDEAMSSLYLVDFSHPCLKLGQDHTLKDVLQTYYEMAFPKKDCLHQKDILLLLTRSPLSADWNGRQRLELDPDIASHLGDATVIAYNTKTRQLNTLS